MTTPAPALVVNDAPGVYIIRCRSNQATYTGSSLRVRSRLQMHLALLRGGCNGVSLLQSDWNTFGEVNFEFLACNVATTMLFQQEEVMTLLNDSLDDFGGYNRMLGNRLWSLSSRIRNSEQKLMRRRKYFEIPGRPVNPRLSEDYVRTFCQRSTPFFKFEPLLAVPLDLAAKRMNLREQLAVFVQIEPGGR
jgi:hypothetical protein